MPGLLVDTDKIGANTEVVARLLGDRGLRLVAVMKGCLGEPKLGAAMLAAGATALADSRDVGLRRMRAALPDAELHRINLPPSMDSFEPGDLNYVTSWQNAEGVARLSAGGVARRIMVQVETGDGREGVPIGAVMGLAERIDEDPRLELAGVSTNYACMSEAPEGIEASVEAVAQVARDLDAAGTRVERVSGGNSSVLWLVARGDRLPAELTELRCGEALLLGHDALHYQPLPGCHEDACVVRAEVVEEYTKSFEGGSVRRLVLAAGHQDLGRGAIRFPEPGLAEVGRSADYLVAELSGESGGIEVGTKMDMIPGYEALVSAWMSPYVGVIVS